MTQEEKIEAIKKLKQGDTFYEVTYDKITKYEYLMLYPFHNPENVKIDGYHIVLDKSLDEPKRMYYTDLGRILLKGIKTYEEARAEQIRLLEIYANFLKKV